MTGVNFSDYLGMPYSNSYGMVGVPFGGAVPQQELFMQQRYLQDRAAFDINNAKKKNTTKAAIGVGAGLLAIGLGILYLKNPARRAKAVEMFNRGWKGIKDFFGKMKLSNPSATATSTATATATATSTATTTAPTLTNRVAGLLGYTPNPTAGTRPIAGLLEYKPSLSSLTTAASSATASAGAAASASATAIANAAANTAAQAGQVVKPVAEKLSAIALPNSRIELIELAKKYGVNTDKLNLFGKNNFEAIKSLKAAIIRATSNTPNVPFKGALPRTRLELIDLAKNCGVSTNKLQLFRKDNFEAIKSLRAAIRRAAKKDPSIAGKIQAYLQQ